MKKIDGLTEIPKIEDSSDFWSAIQFAKDLLKECKKSCDNINVRVSAMEEHCLEDAILTLNLMQRI